LKLKLTQDIGVALSLEDISTIMLLILKSHIPEIFSKASKDGSLFQCSDSFVRLFLEKHQWSIRAATKAAQKVPVDAKDQCWKSFLRQAKAIHDDGIHMKL